MLKEAPPGVYSDEDSLWVRERPSGEEETLPLERRTEQRRGWTGAVAILVCLSVMLALAMFIGTKEGVYDCHVHVVGDQALSGDAHASEGYEIHKVSPTEIHSVWREAGVTQGVASQPSFFGFANIDLGEALDSGGFRGVIALDWANVTMAELQAWHQRGARGLRLNYFRWSRSEWPDLHSDTSKRVLGMVRELEWHIEIYLRSSIIPDVLPALTAAGVKVCVDHFGMPDNHPTEEDSERGFNTLLSQASQPGNNVVVMLSGEYRFSSSALFVQAKADALVRELGPGRLIWGSDFPFTRFEDRNLTVSGQLEKLKAWVPISSDRARVLWDTPVAFYH